MLLSFNLVPRVKNIFAYTLAKWGFCNKVNGSIPPLALPAFIFAFVKLLSWMGPSLKFLFSLSLSLFIFPYQKLLSLLFL